MSGTVVLTIHCDGITDQGKRCLNETSGDRLPVVQARDKARRQGWVYRKKKDLCPYCRTLACYR